MKKGDFLNNFLYPFLVAILTPLITALLSNFSTGSYTTWFTQVPSFYWQFFIAVIGFWFLFILVRNRQKELKKGPGIGVLNIPAYGIHKIADINYDGVKWEVCYPNPPPYSLVRNETINPNEIIVTSPPRCPKCGTELEESKSFWRGYVWKCVRCGFSKRSKENKYVVSERAEKIAKRHFEEELEKSNKSSNN